MRHNGRPGRLGVCSAKTACNCQGEVARFGSSITGLDELGCLM